MTYAQVGIDHCDQTWRNVATLPIFFKVFGNFSMVYLVFAKNIEPTLEIICAMCTFSL